MNLLELSFETLDSPELSLLTLDPPELCFVVLNLPELSFDVVYFSWVLMNNEEHVYVKI